MTSNAEPKKRKRTIVLIVAGGLVLLCVVCGIFGTLSRPKPEGQATATVQAAAHATELPQPTATPRPTDTPRPTNTPRPTDTPVPPTATPDPNLIQPGTYLVGTDIRPGIYKGQAGYDLFASCYWARLQDLSGSLDAVLANDNSIGQFYVEVKESDYAFETRCELRFLPSFPEPPTEFPQRIMPGTYLVGIDIQPGTYRGQAGTEITDSCYWARLRDVSGELEAIIANDNAIGQFYVQVQPSDFALTTKCELEHIGD